MFEKLLEGRFDVGFVRGRFQCTRTRVREYSSM